MHAESPAGAGHQRALPSGQPADLADGIEDGTDGAGDDRGVLQRHFLGYERDVVVLDRDIFGIAADQSPVAGELAVWAQRLAPAPTVTAGTADVIALDGRDAIVLAEAAHVMANLDHGSGDFVSQYARHLHAEFQRAVARDHVVKAHAARIDLDDHILWPRRRIGNLFDLEDIGATRRAHHHRFHWCSFRGLNFNRVTSDVTSSNTASTGIPMRSEPASTPTGLENSRTPQSSRTWITVYGTLRPSK